MASGANVEGLRGLAERIRQGDGSAETELASKFSHRILVMAWMRMHDREAARDLVQDVLMAVIRALRDGQLREADKLAAFVHGTARNLINNQLRIESRKPPLEPLSADLHQAPITDQFEDADRVRAVRQALEHLGREDRKILTMTLVEGRKPGEIASALGLAPEVVRTRKARAVRKVADLIAKKMSRTESDLPHSYKER